MVPWMSGCSKQNRIKPISLPNWFVCVDKIHFCKSVIKTGLPHLSIGVCYTNYKQHITVANQLHNTFIMYNQGNIWLTANCETGFKTISFFTKISTLYLNKTVFICCYFCALSFLPLNLFQSSYLKTNKENTNNCWYEIVYGILESVLNLNYTKPIIAVENAKY